VNSDKLVTSITYQVLLLTDDLPPATTSHELLASLGK